MKQVTLDQAIQIALQHHQAGRLPEAEKIYRQVLAQQPNHPDALNLLGVLASQVGKHDAGAELIRRATALRPDYAEAFSNLGNVLLMQRKFDEAVAACQRSVELKPGVAEAYNNLGNALCGQGKLAESEAAFQNAIQLQPRYADACTNLGNVLQKQGKLDEAVVAFRRATDLKADPDAYINLGNALKDLGQLDEAVSAYRQAIQSRPDFAEAYSNLGVALHGQGKVADAIAAHHQAIALKPDRAESHWNLGVALLLNGDFKSGWTEYEWRLRCNQFEAPHRIFKQPQWHGEDLHGRRILLHAEQGFGDVIQFVRYVPHIVAMGGTVILECQPELYRLLKDFPGLAQVVARGQELPAFDLQCPLLSLPQALGTTLESIPNSIPYVNADPELIEIWKNELAGSSEGSFKVGLAWAGRSTHTNDGNRSLDLRQLAPLAAVNDVQFYSLQKDCPALQAVAPDSGIKPIDFSDKLTDFAQTAALIANLDLVITVDTAVAHLAGAMGRPVWVLLPFVPDWRWMLNRQDSPWYPTMRLFRQKAIGVWDEVAARVTDCLQKQITVEP